MLTILVGCIASNPGLCCIHIQMSQPMMALLLFMFCRSFFFGEMVFWQQTHDRGEYVFTQEDLDGFFEPAAFTAAFEVAGPKHRQRMNELRALKPALIGP